MTQNPFIKVDLHDSATPSTHRGLLRHRGLSQGAWQTPSFIRHPRPGVLAMLCGYRSYSAIAEWGRNYGTDIAQALGFTHNTPCAATLHTIFRCIDREAFEAKVGAWAERVVATAPAAPEAPEIAIAVDGKTLRGSKKHGAPETHLVSVLAHRVGLTLTQQAVAAKTDEIKEVETVFGQIVLTGRIVTMDALLTQRQVAQTIVEADGDYVMIVKDDQPQLKADIELVFTLPPAGDRQETARTVDIGHGHIETRNLTTSEAFVGSAIGRVWHRCSKSGGV